MDNSNCAKLSDPEVRDIQAQIIDLSRKLEVNGKIDMAAGIQEIKMPLNLEAFYFAFPVWLKATRFKSNLNLNYA